LPGAKSPTELWDACGFGSVQKSQSSKATAIFRRGAYFQYVSTGKWRERRWWLFSTDPGRNQFMIRISRPLPAAWGFEVEEHPPGLPDTKDSSILE